MDRMALILKGRKNSGGRGRLRKSKRLKTPELTPSMNPRYDKLQRPSTWQQLLGRGPYMEEMAKRRKKIRRKYGAQEAPAKRKWKQQFKRQEELLDKKLEERLSKRRKELYRVHVSGRGFSDLDSERAQTAVALAEKKFGQEERKLREKRKEEHRQGEKGFEKIVEDIRKQRDTEIETARVELRNATVKGNWSNKSSSQPTNTAA